MLNSVVCERHCRQLFMKQVFPRLRRPVSALAFRALASASAAAEANRDFLVLVPRIWADDPAAVPFGVEDWPAILNPAISVAEADVVDTGGAADAEGERASMRRPRMRSDTGSVSPTWLFLLSSSSASLDIIPGEQVGLCFGDLFAAIMPLSSANGFMVLFGGDADTDM